MELILEGTSLSDKSMKNCHRKMLDVFGDDIELIDYWGPVQMCVFNLEYHYSPRDYTIIMNCERGFLVIEVLDKDGKIFWPAMIYPESRYYHFADVEKDILQLAELVYKAIQEDTIVFYSMDEIRLIRDEWD